MQGTLMEQGTTLMLAGMGTVFVFLTSLVIIMTLMSSVLQRFAPEEAADVSDEEIAAISAAIRQHRKR